MKKKILSLALTACLLFGLSTTAMAETVVNGDGFGDTTATYHIDSQYMVYIPETIDFTDNNSYTITAGLMSLEDGNVVNVFLGTENITLTNASGATMSGSLVRTDTNSNLQPNDKCAQFSNGQTECDYGIYFTPDGAPSDY